MLSPSLFYSFQQGQHQRTDHRACNQSHNIAQRMIHNCESENTAVGCRASTAKQRADQTGYGRANHTGRNHAQRIRRRIRNRALCDEAQTHRIIDRTAFQFLLVHFFLLKVVDKAMAIGGTIPPIITAAMIQVSPVATEAVPNT